MNTHHVFEPVPADPPRRRQDVVLAGPMPATGYVQPQWLVQRSGQFLQVSELLYRVLEFADGHRGTNEIADALTQRTEWAVDARAVQHLIDTKLRPMNLIAAPGPLSADVPSPAPPSPLQMKMKMKVLPQRVIDGLTAALQYLFAPWALLPMIALVIVSHWWLYAVHGVERGVESVLYQPGGLLAVIALGIVAGLFHELGHASALTYGGGRPRGIGFGLYLVYPAFYSDVTDSYRLSRGARVRTDLGGIYFHFIFAAALIAIVAMTGSSFLLAAAILFNIEALRQFIPFVRLDGYWLLADLTGVPDFFSQAGPLMRRQLPAFKPWVKRIFITYLVVTIPVLAYAFVMMLAYTPELIRQTGHALAFHYAVLQSTVPITTKLLSLTQMILLPVPVAATAYFLYAVLLDPLTRLMAPRVSPRTIRLAAAPAAAAVILLAVTALGWTSAAPNRGQALLADAQAAMTAAQSLTADMHGGIGGEAFTGRVHLARPNRARVDVDGSEAVGKFTIVSDGQKVFVAFPETGQYTESRAAPDGRNINAFVVDQVRMFFAPDRLTKLAPGEQVKYIGRERAGASEVDVVEITPADSRKPTWRFTIADDRMVRRVTAITRDEKGQPSVRWVQLENLRLDESVSEQAFQFTPRGKRLGLGDLGIDLSASRR